MPVQQVKHGDKITGFRWGSTGKIYTVAEFGKELARFKALQQGRAIITSKFNKDKKPGA